jgi:regulator of sirC expression with transglutaminase-like and TPR domain
MDLNAALNLLAQDPAADVDLAELALHLARDEYPAVDVEAYLAELAAMAREARRYLRGPLPARVHGLCRYLFHDLGFRGNQKDYYDPRNSYFNQVLDRRTGIPITLSAVAIAVGNRAGLRVEGIGLPGHFIARAADGDAEVLFDPFHGGRVLTVTDCENLVRQATGREWEVTEERLRPAPVGLIAQRMLHNLKGVYLKQSDFGRAARVLERLRQLAPADIELQRDLGVCLIQTGQPGKAIDLLAAYVEAAPQAMDVESVREALQKARATVAGWN